MSCKQIVGMKLHGLPYMYIGHLLSAMLDLTQTALGTPVADSDLELGEDGVDLLALLAFLCLHFGMDFRWRLDDAKQCFSFVYVC